MSALPIKGGGARNNLPSFSPVPARVIDRSHLPPPPNSFPTPVPPLPPHGRIVIFHGELERANSMEFQALEHRGGLRRVPGQRIQGGREFGRAGVGGKLPRPLSRMPQKCAGRVLHGDRSHDRRPEIRGSPRPAWCRRLRDIVNPMGFGFFSFLRLLSMGETPWF